MKYILGVLLSLFVMSCNKESVTVNGKIAGVSQENAKLKLISLKGKEKVISPDIELEDGKFDCYLENVKPPFRLTLSLSDNEKYHFWVFRYGKFDFEINEKGSLVVNNSMENSEYDRIQKNYHKMYLEKLQEKEKWVKTHKIEENLTEEDEFKLFEYQNEIKKAYKLRKKSILSTFRKSPENPIATALLFDEYERLTSWQKEECLKNAQKHFSDCGINWQLRN